MTDPLAALTEAQDDAIRRAFLYVFQLSNIEYQQRLRPLAGQAFLRAIEQDGFTVVPITAMADLARKVARYERALSGISSALSENAYELRARATYALMEQADTEGRID